ncbi:hypothetical protein [Cuneatibacter caecimuris]|uniref:hypothetical protein n=1 Tax=Cuneatibacter caecimuris TaxID=1796618 RepID=UPI0013EED1D3|nr:hypothetical protein [Cuneatibacter caecimuris]
MRRKEVPEKEIIAESMENGRRCMRQPFFMLFHCCKGNCVPYATTPPGDIDPVKRRGQALFSAPAVL